MLKRFMLLSVFIAFTALIPLVVFGLYMPCKWHQTTSCKGP